MSLPSLADLHAMEPAELALLATDCATAEEFSVVIRVIQSGKFTDADGKPHKLPAHTIGHLMQVALKTFIGATCDVFRSQDGIPYLFVTSEARLLNLADGGATLNVYLSRLGFVEGCDKYKLMLSALRVIGDAAPTKKMHGFSYVHPTYSSLYFRASDTLMWRISPYGESQLTVTEVPLGTDDVYLRPAPNAPPLPPLKDVRPYIKELKQAIDDACIRAVAESPMSIITARWATSDNMTPEQMQYLFIARLLLIFCETLSPLRPLLGFTGPSGAGKSTAMEIATRAMFGDENALGGLPDDPKDLARYLSTSIYVLADNMDDTDAPVAVRNLLAKAATGGTEPVRRMYPSTIDLLPLRTNVFFTGQTSPYDRSGLSRRTITLPISAEPNSENTRASQFLSRVDAHRLPILAELVLRLSNILRAYQAHDGRWDTFAPISGMTEFESFTRILADYDGSMDLCVAAWTEHMASQRATVQETSPIIRYIRLWLGEHQAATPNVTPHVGLWATTSTIFNDIERIYGDRKLPPRETAHSFGMALTRSQDKLRQFGVSSTIRQGRRGFSFTPPQSVIDDCIAEYRSFKGLPALEKSTASGKLLTMPATTSSFTEEDLEELAATL